MPVKNLLGQCFGRLIVIKQAGRNRHRSVMWKCRCECGRIVIIPSNSLVRGHTRSCSCLKREQSSKHCKILGKQNRKHGHAVHGKQSPTWRSFKAMQQRCKNSNAPNYRRYGGRGITVAPEWNTDIDPNAFLNFLRDLGERPEGTTLHRKNGNLGYFKNNCAWADDITQQHQAKQGIKLTADTVAQIRQRCSDGEPQNLIAIVFGIHKSHISKIIRQKVWQNITNGQ